jgi:hypothetical protein
MINFQYKDAAKQYYIEPAGENAVGFIPTFFSNLDPRPAREQIEDNYQFGGGFFMMNGFTVGKDRALKYPGDPIMPVLAEAKLRDEIICVYPSAFVAIFQPDGSYVVTRLD